MPDRFRKTALAGHGLKLLALSAGLSIVAHGAMAPLTGSAARAADASAPLYNPESDPQFAEPYIDIDEWRTGPVPHRYVHGGFKGTETRFSFYFPPKEQYQGRFFQHITPVPDSENLAQAQPPGEDNKIGFAVASGAYFVETNGGGKFDLGSQSFMARDPMISAYKANAAAARFSRVVAQKMYGGGRPFGYCYGGSGGGFRTIGALENTHGVWDGAVPYVIGSTMAIPNMFTARIQALRVLRDRFPAILDAVEPGGSGDPYAGLSPVEAAALREVTGMGFPVQAWFGWKTMGVHGFAALYPGVKAADPGYFTDFWAKPGYLGFDHPELFAKDRLQFASKVAQPVTAAEAARLRINVDASREQQRGGVDDAFKIPEGADGARIVGFRLAGTPPETFFLGGDLNVRSGAMAGKILPVARIVGDVVVLGFADARVTGQIVAGDEVQVDNSNFLAMETYHRHQVPGPDFKVWDQFRKPDGTPLYPQRPMIIGPMFVKATAGSLQTGKFEGKMIVVESLWDREAAPWQADWYRGRVASHLGKATDDNFRLYYTDHALHGDARAQAQEAPDRIVSYVPMLHQALRDLSAWVEKDVVPARSTQYRIENGKVLVPPTASRRLGIQPVVTLSVGKGAGKRIDVARGTPVTFRGQIAVPPGGGSVIWAGWDLNGKGAFAPAGPIAAGAATARVSITHRFSEPGTYFVGLKGTSQRQGDRETSYARIENIDRVRVVVR